MRNGKISLKLAASPDARYAEAHAEKRSYRDYELTFATWYTAVLLAVLGGVVTAKFGDAAPALQPFLNAYSVVGWIAAGLAAVVGLSACYCQWYVARRYDEVERYLVRFGDSAGRLGRGRHLLRPRYLIALVQLLLTSATVAAVFAFP